MNGFTRFILVFVFSAGVSIGGEAFDNWYFDYFGQPLSSKDKLVSSVGGRVVIATGSLKGELSGDGQSFVEKGSFEYSQDLEPMTTTLRWEAVGDGSFTGHYEDSNGTKASYVLILKEGKKFVVKSKGPNGTRIISVGSMTAPNTVHCFGKMVDRKGKEIIRILSVIKPPE